MGISVELAETAEENARENDDGPNNNDNMEEGEIAEDDFEDIISSDEEFSMRKRIEELEARNIELEKIANISGIYSCDLGYPSERYKNGSLLALDLSDSEDYGTKKTYTSKRMKSVASKAAVTVATRRNRYKDLSPVLYKSIRKRSQSPDRSLRDFSKTRKRKHEKNKSRISRKTRDRSKKRTRFDYTSSEEEFYSLDRDELRMALRHDLKATNPQGNLRNLIRDTTTRTLDERKEGVEEEEEVSVAIEVKDDSEKGGHSSDDSVSLEEQELRLIALKSAIVKKHMARKKRKEIDEKKPYSPTDFLQPIGNTENDTISPKLFLEHDACNSMDISPIPSPDNLNEDYTDKSVDMDLVDSSNSSSPIFVGQQKWTPINEIPLPSDCNYETENHVSSQFQKIISPMPIRLLQPTGVLPIKPPRCVINIDEDDDETIEIQSNEASSPEPIDEEANALRALLLAQKNSPKFNKDKDLKGAAKKPEIAEIVPEKMLGILSIVEGPAHKTAIILKEAVKRLRKKSPDHCHNSLSSDPSDINTHQLDDICRVHSPEMKLCEQPVVEPPPPTLPAVRSPPVGFNIVKCSGIKENISTRPGSRPNNIQIIPTAVIPRNSRKSPLSEIVETDNVKPKITEAIISKPEPPVIITPPKMSPIKQTVPTLKALQLKTLNLISAGKLLNPNKMIATKLLNKAIHQNNITQIKRKSLTLQNATNKRAKPSIGNRLITKFDSMPTVKKLVIRVGETSESDDCLNDDATASLINNVKIPPDDEYDMASPMSLPMESPRDSPLTIVPSAKTHPTTTSKAVVATAAAANDVSQNCVLGSGDGSDVVVAVTSDPLSTDNLTTPKKSIDTFQAQLDKFLRNARSKVDLIKKETAITTTTTKIIPAASSVPPRTNSTPLAVRHLPPSSQLEYRRLVNRMQTLEKQKQARNKMIMSTIDKSFKVTIRNDIAPKPQLTSNTNDQLLEKLQCPEDKAIGQIAKPNEIIKRVIQNEMNLSSEPLDAVIKPKIIAKLPQSNIISKQVITTTTNKVINKVVSKSDGTPLQATTVLKPVSKPTSPIKKDLTKPHTLADTKLKSIPKEKPKKKIIPAKCKPRSLSECEKDYEETSSSLVQNISKTIDLVVSAKEEKHAKFMLETELEALHEKMLTIEYKIKLRNLKIAKIYPEISSSHKTIMELKTRTSQLEKHSENMGNSLKAGKNKLYTEQKHKIMELSKKLSAEIKNLKNLKLSDYENQKLIETKEKENSSLKCEMFDRSCQVDLLFSKMNDETDGKSHETNNTNNNNNSIIKNYDDGDENDNNNSEQSSFSLSECDTQNVQNSLESMDTEKLEDDGLEQNNCQDCCGVDSVQGECNVDKEKNVILDLESFDLATNESEALNNLAEKESDEKNVSSVAKYISPLNFSNDEEHINPHGVICPYQLMGQCDDKECKFEHLNNLT